MNINTLIQALEILKKYCKEGDEDVSAEHDELYLSPENASEVIDKEDIIKLDKLGFFIDEEYDCIKCFT